MGDVYRAWDSRLARNVAIKVVPPHLAQDPKMLARFEREAKAIAALSHPNILAVFDIGTEQGVSYVVTELLEGETLSGRLGHRAMPWREAVRIGAAIAEGLAAAHSKGIIHRDVKPENIFLTSSGLVKILDFGVARVRVEDSPNDDRPTSAETQAGTVLGTIGYMSPEQVRGVDVEATGDLFSLGCVLYEMVSGRKAFAGQSTADTLAAILNRDPVPLASDVPPEFQQVILRCIEKSPAERFQSARDLAFRMREMLSGTGTGRTAALGVPEKGLDSLAVLPFANASGDPDAEYLSDGITETIINTLSRLRGLRVAARSTVFRYKGRDTDLATVGRELNVRAVLTGRVVQRGDNLRIQAELVNAVDGAQLWGERYHRKAADIFSIEEEIAREISETMRLRLTGDEQRHLEKRYTEDNVAYELYLKGRYYWNRRGRDTLEQAVACFEQAVGKDPRYALAWAGMADSFAVYGAYNVLSPKRALPKARDAAFKALAIDSSLDEAHACLGVVRGHLDFDWVGGEHELRRALEVNPNSATAHNMFTMLLSPLGRADEAIAHGRRALELEPLSLGGHMALGVSLACAERHDEAIRVYRQAIELDPSFVMPRRWLAFAYEQKEMHEEAWSVLQEAQSLFPANPAVIGAMGHLCAIAGRREDAIRLLNDLEEQEKTRYIAPVDLALIYLELGQVDQALEWLEKARDDRSFWFLFCIGSALFEKVRSDPRFEDLLRRMHLAA